MKRIKEIRRKNEGGKKENKKNRDKEERE